MTLDEGASGGSHPDLRACIVNCTLKPSPRPSHTDTLLDIVEAILTSAQVSVRRIRFCDHDIPAGVHPDMTEQGYETDEWPRLSRDIVGADILIVGTPIWLGEKSSMARKLVERLYAHSSEQNERGQFRFYGKVGGCVVTGNEDGVKHVSAGVLYALSHLGYAIPPQADCGWIGEAGPGPSYGDEQEGGGRIGFDNEYTQRTATFMAWNLIHLARMLKDAGGLPAYGNNAKKWKSGDKEGWPL